MSDTCVSSRLDSIEMRRLQRMRKGLLTTYEANKTMLCTRKLCLLSMDLAVCFGMSAT